MSSKLSLDAVKENLIGAIESFSVEKLFIKSTPEIAALSSTSDSFVIKCKLLMPAKFGVKSILPLK